MKKPREKGSDCPWVLQTDFLSDEDFFAVDSQEPKMKRLLRTAGLFCTVSYTDGIPLMHLDTFCSVLRELADELAGLRRYSAGISPYKLNEGSGADEAAEDVPLYRIEKPLE